MNARVKVARELLALAALLGLGSVPAGAQEVTGTIAPGAITPAKISAAGATAGAVLTFDGNKVTWGHASGGGLTLPFAATVSTPSAAAFQVSQQANSPAGAFVLNNPNVSTSALFVSYYGTRFGLEVLAQGSGAAVSGMATGGGAALSGLARGTGTAVSAVCECSGDAMRVVHNGNAPGGNIAVFQSGGSAKARIDRNGKGFFDGGTQTGGADVAELLEAERAADGYSAGDVLVISTTHDRRVEKAREPYSPLVTGVYATRPGVLLTDPDAGAELGEALPVGVIGILPTKVTGVNGPIRRGDLLVTSGTPGHAMKGTDRERMLGAILGKALENFDGAGTGVIKVLVNVK